MFLINLGDEVLVVKKGYILDSVRMASKKEKIKFIYFNDGTLFCVSQSKVEVYNFSIDFTVNPYKIVTQPKDSIQFPESSNK